MATIEERLDELERVLDVAVRAVNPPITIGELNDVPAPGSQIAAQWAQEVSDRIIHRFATVAAMNSWAAGAGSLAYATETQALYRRVGGGWVQVTDANALAPVSTTATNALNTANTANAAAGNAQNTANNALNTANANTAYLNRNLPYGVLGGYPNITSDANGDARINFVRGFQGTPSVAATVTNLSSVFCSTHSVDASGFSVRLWFASGGTGLGHAPWQGTTALGWVASGVQLA